MNTNGTASYPDPEISVKEEVSAPADADKFLSEVDLLRVELSQTRLSLAASALRERRLEDQLEEASIVLKQTQFQVQSHELTIARLNKVRTEIEPRIKALTKEHEAAGRKHDDLKQELSPKYGIKDWNSVAYDDLTGRLSLLPETTKGN